MKHLHLGEGLDLPLETSVVQRYAFVGKSGSGKTYAAGKLVELWLDAGVQVVVFDSAGTWYGLRAAASGGAGIPIPVFGGQHGYSATSSSFNNALGKLRTLGLATRGNIPRASDHLFDGHT